MGYAVVGWIVIQVAVTIFPPLALPAWSTRLVILCVLAGFPIALVLAWAFDVGPSGIKVTPEPAEADQCPPTFSGSRRNLFLLGLFGLFVSALTGYLLFAKLGRHTLDKSIAVLPFSNFSEQSENAFFADGIQDDLLTNLAKIGDLRVISRTSVMPYRGQTPNVKEIAKALDVANVLEGSVRREGNRVRVNVQLVDAVHDQHLWAQIYDRELTDVFAIQSELAQEIAAALKATLSPGEQARIERKPTENSEAYLLYLQAHEIYTRPDRRHDDLARAQALYKKAIELDPSFALAHARLSQLESWSYYAIEPVAARKEKARASAEEALRLQPDLAEGHLAIGLVHYYIDHQYEKALSELDLARQELPNDAQIYRSIAAIKRRQGHWEDSTASYNKALAVDPSDPILLENLGWNYLSVRDFKNAARILDRAVVVAPDTFTIRELRARVDFYAHNDLGPIAHLLATWPENLDPNGTVALARYNHLLYEHKYPELIRFLERSAAEKSRGETSAPISKPYLLGTVYALVHDDAKAKENFERAREQAEAAVHESPEDGPRHALLGLIYASLGRCPEAEAEGQRAVELLPETTDAFDGPILAISGARISVRCGDRDQALAIIEHSLSRPAGVTVSELRRDPTWDSLRNDPRFQKLLSEKAAGR